MEKTELVKIIGLYLIVAVNYDLMAYSTVTRYLSIHNPVLDNLYIADQYFLEEIVNTSKTECSRACARLTQCVSFFYNESQRRCRLHSTGFYNQQEGVTVSKWQYHMFGEKWCPVYDGFIHERYYNVCLHLSETRFNGYEEARAYCLSKNSWMISTASKVSNLTSIMNKINISFIDFFSKDKFLAYIGLEYINSSWVWNDGSILSSSTEANWGINQPNMNNTRRKCGVVGKSADSVWNWHMKNAKCHRIFPVICEID